MRATAGSPAWWLVAITTALVASFLCSTLFAQRAARAIDGRAVIIATDISPSVSGLAEMRTQAHWITVGVQQALSRGESHFDADALDRLERALQLAFDDYAVHAQDPEEASLLEPLREKKDRLVKQARATMRAIEQHRFGEAERLLETQVGPCEDDLQTLTHRLSDVASREARGVAKDIQRLRLRAEKMAYGLNALTAVLGLSAMLLAARASRQQIRLLHDKERQLSQALLSSRREGERSRVLQEVTAALSEALTPEDVGNVVTARAVPAVGGAGGALFRVIDEHHRLALVAAVGSRPEILDRVRELPLEGDSPLAEVARGGEPLFFADQAAASSRYPTYAAELSQAHLEGLVVLPLQSQGTALGVMVVCFVERHPFDEEQQRLALTMANLCAQALERARLYGEAESGSRAKDEFLAMLGHELRNPLAPMMTALQLMKLRGAGAPSREQAVIERQLAHLTRLVDDLLDVSRITRGKVELKRRPVELSGVVARALEVAAPLLEQRRHRLVMDVPNTGLLVNADEPRLVQVVSNLMTNAAKYTPPGGAVTVTGRREGDEVALSVRDNGMGIDPDLLPRVFDLFVQGPRSIARSEGGLGLGLALVRSLVALHGGTVRASSPGPGYGSEFTVRLPAARVDILSASGAPPLGAGKHGCEHRLLVVDDNTDAADALAETLRELGFEVLVAYDGPRALELIRQTSVEVALLDIGLPVMDGYELAQRLRATSPHTRLIAVTGYGQEHDRQRAHEAGFEQHFVKPVDLAQLLHGIEVALAAA